ncbi:MAG: hypothetical protein QOK42_1078 [Frankiaceae bacterium]|nr:hypothetical protein [Frankiaceae bacterium]
MRSRLTLLPGFGDAALAETWLRHVGFHLGHLPLERLQVVTTADADELRLAAGPLADRLEVVAPDVEPAALRDGTDFLLLWSDEPHELVRAVREGCAEGVSVVHLGVDQPDAALLALATLLDPQAQATRESGRSRLLALLDGTASRCVVLVGPDADLERREGDTVIATVAALGSGAPDVVVVDERGAELTSSPEGAALRDRLSAATSGGAAVLVADQAASLLRALIPGIESSLATVLIGPAHMPAHGDLRRVPLVRGAGDVLTRLALPLALSLAAEVVVAGTQAKPTDVGPLEAVIRAGEVRGRRVSATAQSQSLPLVRRSPRPLELALTTSAPAWIAVNPDWTADFGHHLPFQWLLESQAARAGVQTGAWVSRGFTGSLEPGWHPVFSHPTIGDAGIDAWGSAFEAELRGAVTAARASLGEQPLVLACYAADIGHLPHVLAVLAEDPNTRAVVNLMRAHTAVARALSAPDPAATQAGWLLRRCLSLAPRLGLTVTADTDVFADDILRLTGLRPHVWPMVALASLPPGERPTPGVPRVYAPIKPQAAKGFAEFAAVAMRLVRDGVRAAARVERHEGGLSAEIAGLVDQMREAGVDLVEGTLSEDEYAAQLRAADVAVLPYRASEFRTRTSGVLLDAARAGTPVVVASGTWLAEVTEEHGLGAVYTDGDVDDLERTVHEVLADTGARAAVAAALPALEQRFHPDRLGDALQAAERTPRPAVEESTGVELDELLAASRVLFGSLRAAQAEATVQRAAAVSRELAAAAAVQSARLREELAARGLRWRQRADQRAQQRAAQAGAAKGRRRTGR